MTPPAGVSKINVRARTGYTAPTPIIIRSRGNEDDSKTRIAHICSHDAACRHLRRAVRMLRIWSTSPQRDRSEKSSGAGIESGKFSTPGRQSGTEGHVLCTCRMACGTSTFILANSAAARPGGSHIRRNSRCRGYVSENQQSHEQDKGRGTALRFRRACLPPSIAILRICRRPRIHAER